MTPITPGQIWTRRKPGATHETRLYIEGPAAATESDLDGTPDHWAAMNTRTGRTVIISEFDLIRLYHLEQKR